LPVIAAGAAKVVTLHEGLADPSVGMIGAAFSHAQAMAAF